LGFRAIGVFLFLCFSCNPGGVEEYSFLNKLNKDVELFLFMGGNSFEDKVKDSYLISSGDYVMFIKLQTDDRDGYGQEYFCNHIDSAKLRIAGEDEFIAIWRDGEEPMYSKGYEIKWNFLCEWREKI